MTLSSAFDSYACLPDCLIIAYWESMLEKLATCSIYLTLLDAFALLSVCCLAESNNPTVKPCPRTGCARVGRYASWMAFYTYWESCLRRWCPSVWVFFKNIGNTNTLMCCQLYLLRSWCPTVCAILLSSQWLPWLLILFQFLEGTKTEFFFWDTSVKRLAEELLSFASFFVVWGFSTILCRVFFLFVFLSLMCSYNSSMTMLCAVITPLWLWCVQL